MSLSHLTLAGLLDAVAAKSPVPGGGAVACTAGALAASLASMVVAYSLNKKDLAAHQGTLENAQRHLANTRAMLLQLADEDAAAYELLNSLQKLPAADAHRAKELPAAAEACAQIPLAALAACVDLLRICADLAPITNPHLRSDLHIAAILAKSAADSSAVNTRINYSLLSEASRATHEATVNSLITNATQLTEQVITKTSRP